MAQMLTLIWLSNFILKITNEGVSTLVNILLTTFWWLESSGVAYFISVSVKIKSRPCSQRLYSVVMRMMEINMKGKMSSQEVMRMMMRRKQLWRQEQKTLPIRLFFNSTFFKFLIGIPNICYKIYGPGKWIFFVAMFLRGRLSCSSNEKP